MCYGVLTHHGPKSYELNPPKQAKTQDCPSQLSRVGVYYIYENPHTTNYNWFLGSISGQLETLPTVKSPVLAGQEMKLAVAINVYGMEESECRVYRILAHTCHYFKGRDPVLLIEFTSMD